MKKEQLFVLLAVCGLLLPGAGRALDCAEVRERLQQAIPDAAGDAKHVKKMLSPRVASPQMGRAFDAARAARSLGDKGLAKAKCCGACAAAAPHGPDPSKPHDHAPPGDCTYGGAGGSQMRVSASQGRYVYLNPGRSHQGFTQNDIEQARAIEKTREALLDFGVPRGEIDAEGVEARDLVLAAQALGSDGELSGKQRRARAEVHVIYPRRVDGTPVFDSFGRAAIDAKGEVARLHVSWPDFCIPASARSASVRSRRELIDAAMASIESAGSCDTVGAVGATVAYVQEKGLTESAALAADDDEAGDDSTCYVPGVVISVVGPEGPKQNVALAGQLLAFPLLGGARDGGNQVFEVH